MSGSRTTGTTRSDICMGTGTSTDTGAVSGGCCGGGPPCKQRDRAAGGASRRQKLGRNQAGRRDTECCCIHRRSLRRGGWRRGLGSCKSAEHAGRGSGRSHERGGGRGGGGVCRGAWRGNSARAAHGSEKGMAPVRVRVGRGCRRQLRVRRCSRRRHNHLRGLARHASRHCRSANSEGIGTERARRRTYPRHRRTKERWGRCARRPEGSRAQPAAEDTWSGSGRGGAKWGHAAAEAGRGHAERRGSGLGCERVRASSWGCAEWRRPCSRRPKWRGRREPGGTERRRRGGGWGGGTERVGTRAGSGGGAE